MRIFKQREIAPYYAPLSCRVISGIIDSIGFYVISFLTLLYVLHIEFSFDLRYLLLLNIYYLIFAIPYHVIMEYKYGYTIGKKLLKLRVEHDNGTPCTLESVIIRNILRAIDIVPVFYIIGIIFIIFTVDRKRIGDIIAHTIVVKED